MQLSSIFDNENDLIAQNQDIGIPTAEELYNSPNTKWTGPYVEENGMDDGGYWESIMDEFDETEYPQSESIAPTDKPQIILDEGTSYAYTPPILEAQIEYNHTLPAPQQQETVNVEKPYMLEGGVEHNVTIPKQNIISSAQDLYSKYKGLTPGAAIQKAAAKLPIWKSSEKEYYQHALKRADGEEPTDFMKEQNDFYKLDEISNPELKQIYIDKAAKMYGLDVNDPETYDAIKNTEIVIPKENSQLYSQIKDSEDFQKLIAENYENIINQNNKNTSIEFPAAFWNNDKRANYATIHNADLKNSKINDDGSFSTILSDAYDFENWEKQDWIHSDKNAKERGKMFIKNLITPINNSAKKQQDMGQLERYLLSTPIKLSKEELEEILRRYNKL